MDALSGVRRRRKHHKARRSESIKDAQAVDCYSLSYTTSSCICVRLRRPSQLFCDHTDGALLVKPTGILVGARWVLDKPAEKLAWCRYDGSTWFDSPRLGLRHESPQA